MIIVYIANNQGREEFGKPTLAQELLVVVSALTAIPLARLPQCSEATSSYVDERFAPEDINPPSGGSKRGTELACIW